MRPSLRRKKGQTTAKSPIALARRGHQSEMMRIDYLASSLPASYVVFDMLYVKGRNVMDLPLWQRKRPLYQALPQRELVIISDKFAEKSGEYFDAALKIGIEIYGKELRAAIARACPSSL